MTTEQMHVIAKITDARTFERQLEQTVEEAAEFIQAAQKIKRYPGNSLQMNHLVEETGDLLITLEQIRIYLVRDGYGDALNSMIDYKLNRGNLAEWNRSVRTMKARLITIGESEIRQRVEEEYQKKKDQIYESVIQDVLPQFMSVCMVELNKEFGFGEKRLRSVLDGVKDHFKLMDGVGILNHQYSTLDCLTYLQEKYGIDLDKELL